MCADAASGETRSSWWRRGAGLAFMVASNLFPGGMLQLVEVPNHGYCHARGPEFLNERTTPTIEGCRLPGDGVFIGLGVLRR